MTAQSRPNIGRLPIPDRASGRYRCSATLAIYLLLVCVLVAGCSLRANNFVLAPRNFSTATVHPLRVGVVAGRKFTPYKMTFRWWSSLPFTWALDGLPAAFVEILRVHFASVELVQESPSASKENYDVIARMWVDRLHFDGANTTAHRDRVDLTMTFVMQRLDTTEVFKTTISATGTSPYRQPCRTGLCNPDPRKAFTGAFNSVFDQLSQRLAAAGLTLAQATR